jgi:hypothetical protein
MPKFSGSNPQAPTVTIQINQSAWLAKLISHELGFLSPARKTEYSVIIDRANGTPCCTQPLNVI